MATKKENLGKLLATLEEMSNKEINGEKIDFSLNGKTYREIDKKAKKLLAKIHPDLSGSFSEEDQKICNTLTQNLNSVRELIKDYKTANNIKDTDEFTYVKEALEDYHQKQKSKRSNPPPRSNTKKAASPNSSSSTYSEGSKTNHTNKNNNNNKKKKSTNSSSKSTQKTDKLVFNNGILTKTLDENKNHISYKTKDGSKIYGYTFTEKNGKMHKIYSENTFEELSEPNLKWNIENVLLGTSNLRKANSYNVQDANSQYGYIGNLYSEFIPGFPPRINYNLNKKVIAELREVSLRKTSTLSFSSGTLTRKLKDNNEHSSYSLKNGSKIYGYIFTEKNGTKHEIYSENTFEELSEPNVKWEVENYLLGTSNLRKANSYNVQDANSQYGYVGNLYTEFIPGFQPRVNHDLNKEVIEKLREASLRKTTKLSFDGGTLTKKLKDNNEHSSYSLKNGSKIYGYIFTEKNGTKHEIYSENTFEKLSEPNVKWEVENYLLGTSNLRKANSYNIQDANSQYGYVGNLYTEFIPGFQPRVNHDLNKEVIENLRKASLRKTTKLSFDRGTLTKKLKDNNEHSSYILKNGSKIYGYIFTEKNFTKHEIYSENTFEELSEPSIKWEVENYLLGTYNLSKANSYNIKNNDSQYGYVGNLSPEYGIGNLTYRHSINPDNLAYFKERFKCAPLISIAKNSSGKQDTITLSNGKKLYGYEISRQGENKNLKKRMFFENSTEEMIAAMKNFVSNGHSKLDLYNILVDSFENCEKQYGYMGTFTQDGVKVNEEISQELEERFKKVKAKGNFEKLMSKELLYEKQLQEIIDEK